jgi:transcription elongation factor GreB
MPEPVNTKTDCAARNRSINSRTLRASRRGSLRHCANRRSVSRAFVKEDDDRPERPLPRIADSEHPNYVTPDGLAQLRAALARARSAGDEREAEYLQARVESARVIEPPLRARKRVAFGAHVVLQQADGSALSLHLVGDDEADPASGKVSWTSPYARALDGHRAGDRVAVHRPAGATVVVIESISYDPQRKDAQ